MLRQLLFRPKGTVAPRIVTRMFFAAALGLLLTGRGGLAQSAAGDPKATRVDLAQRTADLEKQLSVEKSGRKKGRIQAEMDSINVRLTEGDFAVGDLLVITIVWDQVVSDTATVRDGLTVAVRGLPDFPVKGVLRSELTDQLTVHVSKYLRNVQVRTNALTRVSIQGAIGKPGFYSLSPDRPVSELLMLAGGPLPDAKLDKMEIRRAGRTLMSRGVVKDGRTLDQLGVRSGDEVWLPKKRRFNWQLIVQMALLAATLFLTFTQFLQWYYREE